MDCIIAIDQGTTSTRAIAFDPGGNVLAADQTELEQYFPGPGWVEHDPEEIWEATVATLKAVIDLLEDAGHDPVAIGITNQRETCIVWDRKTGKTVHRAIVWQDRRTADICQGLKDQGLEEKISAKTGLLLDPYFSGTKVAWILDQDTDIRAAAERGELAFGTVESFLLWRLTGGRHASDATNASRTLLFDINAGSWDDELLDIFGVPRALLPEVTSNSEVLGTTSTEMVGREIPITAMIGDQQSAAVGQGCISPGMVKSTYGTGCFVIENTGGTIVRSANRLLSTVAFKIGDDTSYALEGSIFIAGAAIQWLRDGLKLFQHASDTEELARSADARSKTHNGVYMVPAFTGLGAPHWDAHARGAIYGLTRDTDRADIVRAALEAVAYQTHDLLAAATADGAHPPDTLRVDGGMVMNDWFAQCLADTVGTVVDRPKVVETTAFGAAFLAGLSVGLYFGLADVSKVWQLDKRFEPGMDDMAREAALAGWQDAVRRTLSVN